MTRIVGKLEGADGPLNGRLFVKAGGAFIGAPDKELVFKIEQGIVDIELPPCPPSMPYAVDWRAIGDTRRLSYVERWRVGSVEEMSLDEARGLVRANGRSNGGTSNKGSLIEATMLRSELDETKNALASIEEDHAKLLRKLTEAESRAAAAQAQNASLSAELSRTKQKLVAMGEPTIVETERVVERLKTPSETKLEQAALFERISLLEQENERLKEQSSGSIAAATHFANLIAEIDRLSNEKQSLLRRIEELKRPVRNSSAMRNEAIANLDRIVS